jgi:hypothetical protein
MLCHHRIHHPRSQPCSTLWTRVHTRTSEPRSPARRVLVRSKINCLRPDHRAVSQ